MKKLLLFIIVICWFGNETFGQKREHKAEADGFEWYLLREEISPWRQGAEVNGKIILPCVYGYVWYSNKIFTVSENKNDRYKSYYDINGKCLAHKSKQYETYFANNSRNIGDYIRYKKSDGCGICDINGREIIFMQGVEWIGPEYINGKFFYNIKKANRWGVADGNGKIIIEPQYIKCLNVTPDNNFVINEYSKEKIIGNLSSIITSELPFSSIEKKDFKEKNVEDDGFVWYSVIMNGQKAVEDNYGKLIIPLQDKDVKISYVDGFFKTTGVNHYVGAYDRKGRIIISPDRGYKDIRKLYVNGKTGYCYIVKNHLYNEGVCDANGKELLSPKEGYKIAYVYMEDGIPYIRVEKESGNDKYRKIGILNIKGEEIIPAEYESVIYFHGQFKTSKKLLDTSKYTGISLNSSSFYYNKNEISFTPSLKDSFNYANDNEIKKELQENLVDGFKWLIINNDGKYGAIALDGNTLVPMFYDSIWYDPFSEGFDVKNRDFVGFYSKDGQCIIPVERGYKEIFKMNTEEYGRYYRVALDNKHIGVCDENGKEIISPLGGLYGGYDEVILTKWNDYPFAVVMKDGKYGAYNMDGNILISDKEDLGISEETGTFTFKGADGNIKYSSIGPDGTERENSHRDVQTNVGGKNQWLVALSLGIAGAANIYANIQAQKATMLKESTFNQMNAQNVYSGSSDYLSSPAYFAQAQARANQTMQNYQTQIQRIGQQALQNNQQMMNRSRKMFSDMLEWSIGFNNKNGRDPLDYEKLQWVYINYPDMYNSFVMALSENSNTSEETKQENNNPQSENNNKSGCSYCGGTGRILQESEVLSFGLPEKDYKCIECGKWKYKGSTHKHIDCPHCKK